MDLFAWTMKSPKEFLACLGDRELMPTALKVSFIVGSLLFSLNHGSAILKGQMNRDRWLAGFASYLIPYAVNIHGQCASRSRQS